MVTKNITIGHEGRLKIKAGIDKGANAVKPTLGPIGMTAVIEWPGLDPIEADDGVTILNNLEFRDRYENIGLQKLRKAGVRTSKEGGDGTATTTILTQALVGEAIKEIGRDSSKIRQVRERLEEGLKETISELTKVKRNVLESELESIATISSLDPYVAKHITDIIKEVGINGVVTVEKGAKLGYSKEIVKGVRFDKGFLSTHFVTDKDRMEIVLNNPYIVLIDRRVSTNGQIMSLLNSIGTGAEILFIADDVDSVALATLAQNAMLGIAKIGCVRNPYTGARAKDFLLDVGALTGATVISEETGMKLDTATKESCGKAEKVVVTKDRTTIMGGKPSKDLDSRVNNIKDQIENTTSEWDKEILEERLAQLTGGIGVIRVGAYTDTEFNAKKYKFENAINSTQAALQEGIVAGGGVALLAVSEKVKEPMFIKTLKAPIRQMIINAGMYRPNIVQRILKSEVPIKLHTDGVNGYNFVTKKQTNMFDAGIIDPFKVTRLALESATAIAISLISMETIITEDK